MRLRGCLIRLARVTVGLTVCGAFRLFGWDCAGGLLR